MSGPSSHGAVSAGGRSTTTPRLKIAYVSAQLPSYDAAKHRVVERSKAALSDLATELEFELLAAWDPVVQRDEAEAVAAEADAAGADLVLLQSSSFAMGDVVLPFADRAFRLGLWAPQEPTRAGPIPLNSFVSMHLHAGVLAHYLRSRRRPFKWFFGRGDHPWFAPRLRVTVAALRAIQALQGARIGWVGGLAPTFVNLVFDERELAARYGIEVVAHDLREVVARARNADPAEVETVLDDLRRAARGRVEVAPEAMRANAAVYLALRDLAREHDHRALAVSDWPLFQQELSLHPGLAFSWLDEHDGVPVASEGDVVGAASMLLGRGASGQGAMLLDMNDVDLDAGALLMWHCGGSPLGFADDDGVRWLDHSTLGRNQPGATPMGAVAELRFRRGPATILRLVRGGEALFVLDAEVVDHPAPGFSGSRGWLADFRDDRGPVALADLVDTVMSQGLEHHFALAAGRCGGALREAAAWLGLPTTPIVPYRDHLRPGD